MVTNIGKIHSDLEFNEELFWVGNINNYMQNGCIYVLDSF